MFETAQDERGLALARDLAALRLADVDEDGLVGALAWAEKLVRWATAAQLALISELARRRGTPEFLEDEVAAELRLSRVAAGTRVGLAVDLDRRPALGAAMASGQVDLPKAKAIADAVSVLDSVRAEQVTADAVGRAERQTVGELRAWLRRTVLTADPAAAEARHAQALADRRVTLTPVGDGMAELWALLRADEAARAYAVIDAYARETVTPCAAEGGSAATPKDPGWLPGAFRSGGDAVAAATNSRRAAEDSGVTAPDCPVDTGGSAITTGLDGVSRSVSGGRTADQRRADALVDLLIGRASAPAAKVHVTVPLATVVGAAEHPGELAGVGPVPASMARALAADGLWRWLGLTDAGAVNAIGRRGYRPPAALADLIRGRDRTCRFPGCRQPAHRCDLDHTVPYPAGPTSAANLTTLCRHHHRLKHEGGWSVRQHRDARLTWTSPTGRTYTTSPPRHPTSRRTSPSADRTKQAKR